MLTPFRKSQKLLNWTHNIQLSLSLSHTHTHTHWYKHQSWYNRVKMYKMTSFLCICGPDCIRKHELTQSEPPPNSRRVLSQVTALCLCHLCPSGVAIVEDSHRWVCKVLLLNLYYSTDTGQVVDFGLLRWLPLLQLTITTHTTTITATKSLCFEARVWRCIITAHRILQQVVVIIHVLLRQKNVTLVSVLNVQSSLTL